MADETDNQRQRLPGRRVESARRHLLDRTRADISDRLRRFCTHMSAEEFEAFVSRAAEIEIKFEVRQREVLLPLPRRSQSLLPDQKET
jgi:hypothetical protein